jgi:2-polyprenyl-3-methyl-5-hydroxy-6-metoxy-1,4-benzoquinol methylase
MHYVFCPLCGADDTTLRYAGTLNSPTLNNAAAYLCTNLGYGKHHPIVQCGGCGMVYANPRYTTNQLTQAYQEVVDPLYEQEREGRVLTFQRHLRPVEAMVGEYRGKRILDVGAYTGVFVEIAAQRGWDAYGVELSTWATTVCRERGLNVFNGTLEQAHFPSEFFDVVTAWDVVEHLDDPRLLLTEMYRVLKVGGVAVIHTIDIDAPFARLMGRHWPWLMEMHLVYFSRRTLAMMLAAVGYIVLHATPQGRYQKLSYLVSRLGWLSPRLARIGELLVKQVGLAHRAVPINLGDLVTTYATKAESRKQKAETKNHPNFTTFTNNNDI